MATNKTKPTKAQRGIPARMQAETEMHASNARFRLVAAATHTMVYDLDVMAHRVIAWDGVQELLGYEATEVELTLEWWDRQIHPDDLAKCHAAFQQMHSDGNGHALYYRLRHQDGRTIEVEDRALAVRDVNGRLVRIVGTVVDITDRKRNEAALRASEARLAAFAAATFEGIVESEAGRILDCNEQYARMTGYSVEELRGMEIVSLIPVADRERILTPLREAREAVTEATTIRKDGTVIIVESHGRQVSPDSPRRVSTVRDITAHKQAEAALRASEERLRFALETIQTEAWDLDLVDHTTFRSVEHDRIFGYPALLPQWTYEMFLEHVLPEDRAAVDGQFRRAMEQRGDWNFECRIRRADGEVRWILAAGRHREDATGAPRRMAGIVQDITARKQAEEKLRESEERFRVAQELSPDGFAILRPVRDSAGRIVDFTFVYENAAIARINGTDPAAVVGRRISEFLPAHSQSPFHAAHARVADTGETCIMEQKYDGGDIPRPTWFRVAVVRTGQDIAILSQDITERKQAEDRDKAALAEKEVLLKEIHHRVKNNLQIMASLVNLQADSATDARVLAEFATVRDRISAMAYVHETLYQTENLAELNFADYAQRLLRNLWNVYRGPHGTVRLNLAIAPVNIPIDKAVSCGLILSELATNALKYAFPDGRDGIVTVTLEHEAATGAVCLRVQDNGVGLPAGVDWRQTKSLGLRLVNILAGQLRGTLETGPGPGTEFRVNFKLS